MSRQADGYVAVEYDQKLRPLTKYPLLNKLADVIEPFCKTQDEAQNFALDTRAYDSGLWRK